MRNAAIRHLEYEFVGASHDAVAPYGHGRFVSRISQRTYYLEWFVLETDAAITSAEMTELLVMDRKEHLGRHRLLRCVHEVVAVVVRRENEVEMLGEGRGLPMADVDTERARRRAAQDDASPRRTSPSPQAS